MNIPIRAVAVVALAAGLLAPVTAHAETDALTVTVVHPEPTGTRQWWTGPVPVHIGVESAYPVTGTSTITLSGATTRTQAVTDGTTSLTIDAEGQTEARWAVANTSGASRTGSFTIRVDSVPPTAAVYASVSGGVVRQGDSVALTAECRDKTSGLTTCDLAGDVLDQQWLDTSRPGTATTRALATDAAGHQTVSVREFTVLPDDTLPTATITVDGEPASSGWHLTRPLVHVAATAAEGGADVAKVRHRTRVGGSTGSWYDQVGRQATVVLPGDGAHLVDARAVDQRGSLGSIVTRAVKVDTKDPRVDLPALPELRQGEKHRVTPACADPESGVTTCELSGDVDPRTGDVRTSSSGPVTVRLTATDHAGRTASVERSTTVEPPALQVAATGPKEVAATDRATITVTTSADGVDPSRTVEILDGTTSLGSYQLDLQHPLAATTGRATIRLPRLKPGTHTIAVVYRALPALTAGTTEARATLTISSKARSTASARWSVSRRAKGWAHVTVTASGTTPRGKVQLYDGPRRLATATLTSRGKAKVRVPRLAKGRHRLRVRYLGSSATFTDWSSTRTVRLR